MTIEQIQDHYNETQEDRKVVEASLADTRAQQQQYVGELSLLRKQGQKSKIEE